jgi:hypothetical protein
MNQVYLAIAMIVNENELDCRNTIRYRRNDFARLCGTEPFPQGSVWKQLNPAYRKNISEIELQNLFYGKYKGYLSD